MVIEDDQGLRLAGFHQYVGIATNNQAEYQALITGLQKAAEWRPDRLELYLDSLLVVEQLNGRYRVKNAELAPLFKRATELLRGFSEVAVQHVERARNRGADALANRGIDEWQAGVAGKIPPGPRRTGGRRTGSRG